MASTPEISPEDSKKTENRKSETYSIEDCKDDLKKVNKRVDDLIKVNKLKISEEDDISAEDYNKAVDDLVNVNKLFTIAVFLGLAVATGRQHSLENRAECDAGTIVAKRLIVFEVVSFTCFLSSTFVAMAVKLHLHVFGGGRKFKQKIRETMIFVAGLATFFAYLFLMLSMVDIIQIRLGKLSCRGSKSLSAAVSVISIVSSALAVFMFLMLPPLYKSISHVKAGS
ncbi:hypothetical protein LOK49_LG15G00974 [Camellia lanceoleosa]|uniref:Uncharacterized protein n=1 Tax=Camellia lanceoleosa TaxID=1840588 RepID=A0ACC0F446_9ERIC|nr:hypothetical protein LOK49_LG15G00974 [Camellia lanceoleosa]